MHSWTQPQFSPLARGTIVDVIVIITGGFIVVAHLSCSQVCQRHIFAVKGTTLRVCWGILAALALVESLLHI